MLIEFLRLVDFATLSACKMPVTTRRFRPLNDSFNSPFQAALWFEALFTTIRYYIMLLVFSCFLRL